MSATRDPDRIFRAWLEQMPDEAPDRTIAAVLLATAGAPQVRSWPRVGPWRLPMNRLSLIAAVAVILAALIGGAYVLVGNNSSQPALPTATPAASVIPLAPESLRATWVANATSGAQGRVATLDIKAALISVVDDGTQAILARAVPGAADEFTISAPDSTRGCQAGDVGRYRYAFGTDGTVPDSDGTLLTLTAIADACASRQAILERTWVRGMGDQYRGGRAAAVKFEPMFMVTLPTLAYGISFNERDALMVEPASEPWGAFVATRNPWGFTEPCTDSGGAKLPVAPTIDAFVAYLDNLPGFTVQRSAVKLGPLDAVRLTIPTIKTPECQDRGENSGRIAEWTNSDPAFNGNWILGQGDTDVMYLVETNGALFLFQWLATGVTLEDEMAVLSTIRIIERLPT